uniref:Uncharacterized protein n=1 Tax=Cryptomonas curvata TaxID=233186 RepID=A0A7S0N7J7_9CRYP|mmetsp:Transcript_8641/g.18603  ORF Transcript_8641/g.18603 Transcript_8641/m.18603 type:complete len:1388 (+) Transcript_8641:372-4535(+)
MFKVTVSGINLNKVAVTDQDEIINEVEKQFKEVLDKHKRRSAKWYNDDGRYRSAVIEMLNMKENAMAVPDLSDAMHREWKSKHQFLRQANRMVSKDMSRALRTAGSNSDERNIAAFKLCQKNGIVAEQLEERNEMSETPLIREAAEGDARAVAWLLDAGADVNARMENEMGFTAINQAAYFGNATCIIQLLKHKADPCVVDRSGATPLFAAAQNGELECIKVLLKAGADRTFDERVLRSTESIEIFKKVVEGTNLDLKRKRDRLLNGERLQLQGTDGNIETNSHEHQPALERNEENGGVKSFPNEFEKVKYINKATFPALFTPLMAAAVTGHVSCVRVLILAGAGKGLLNSLGQTAKSLVEIDIVEIKKIINEFDVKIKNLHYYTVEESSFAKENTGIDKPPVGNVAHETKTKNDISGLRGWLRHYKQKLQRLEICARLLDMTQDQIRMEESSEVLVYDASRKDSHLKIFENLALHLEQELQRLIDSSRDSWCDHIQSDLDTKSDVLVKVVQQFKDVMSKHKARNPRWYNDGGRYMSAVTEMLSMNQNAMAVPKLSMAMFEEWKSNQWFLRQANRMATRESWRALYEKREGSDERRAAALELCKSAGIVTELLEERNEMSETPLIREAADGNARNLCLLLEAGADVHAKQEHQIGFAAINQAAYFGHAACLRHLLDFMANVNIEDGFGGTPLDAAALNGEEECVKVLIDAGADVNHQNSHGYTPLMKAAQNGHSVCVRMLIVAGADTTLKSCRPDEKSVQKNALALTVEKRTLVRNELLEFQNKYLEPKPAPVTYPILKDKYVSYIWDATIGLYGGFRYRTKNKKDNSEEGGKGNEDDIGIEDGHGNEELEPITDENAGTITKIPEDTLDRYCSITQILGLSKVTMYRDMDVVKNLKGTLYGWDHSQNCWTYFVDQTKDKPTHFARYKPTGERKPVLLKRNQHIISTVEQSYREWKHAGLKRTFENYEVCVKSLQTSVEDIREEDFETFKEMDSTRKALHMKTFEMQAFSLKRELDGLVQQSTSEFCCRVDKEEIQDVLARTVIQFKNIKQKHQKQSPKWYNDDGKYRSGVIEMLGMKDSAMAVPKITLAMYQELKNEPTLLRQASRMMLRERFRAMREAPRSSEERKEIALEACKARGAVVEYLEELNEMLETPLIREAADGNAKNVVLLLEAAANLEAQQIIGFTALHQAAYFGQVQCVELLLKFRADVDSVDLDARTPLIAATVNGEVECVRVLLDERASIDHATADGTTALMKAALHGHVVCVRLLLGLNADVKKENINGKTSSAITREEKEEEASALHKVHQAAMLLSVRQGTRSMEMRRRQQTEIRLEKMIANHETVLQDLEKTAEDIRNEPDNAELFVDRSVTRNMRDPEYSHADFLSGN